MKIPTILSFEAMVMGIVLVMIITAIFSGVFEFKIRRLRKRLVRERLRRFVQKPWVAADLYYNSCNLDTALKRHPFIVCREIFTDKKERKETCCYVR